MNPETLERSLKSQPFVSDLDDSQLRFLLGCTKNVRFAAGDYLAREGDKAEALYLIRTGRIALESHIPGRGVVTLESLGAGEIMGWSVMFPPHYWHVDARAVDTTLAFAVDGHCLRDKLEADHSFAYAITRRMLADVHKRLRRTRLQQLDVYRSESSPPLESRS